MTIEGIIRMAKQAGFADEEIDTCQQILIHFAKLVAEHEHKWVGLTNEEITDLYHKENLGQQSAVAQAMALLKERNT